MKINEIDQVIEDINAFRRKENFVELQNSAASLFELLKKNKPVDNTWKWVDRSQCHYCSEIFLLYRYNNLKKFHGHLGEHNELRNNHSVRCPEKPRCHTCSYTDEKCTEKCERCGKGHYYCECYTIVFIERLDSDGNRIEMKPIK